MKKKPVINNFISTIPVANASVSLLCKIIESFKGEPLENINFVLHILPDSDFVINGYLHSKGAKEDSEFTNTAQKADSFASYSHKLGGLNVIVCLQYEFTSGYYTEDSGNDPVNDHIYSDMYPNITVSDTIKNVDLITSFNKRTKRSSSTQLNGNVIYIKRFFFQKVNTYLNKSNIYNLDIQASLKPFYFKAGYTYSKKPVFNFFQQQENSDNAILSTYVNFPKYETMYATLNFNHTIGFWHPNCAIRAERLFFEATYDGKQTIYDKTGYFFSVFNDFTLPYDIILSCNFLYQNDEQYAFFESKGYHRFDAGIRKSFLGNTLILYLIIYDLFDNVKDFAHMQLDNIFWDVDKKNKTCYSAFSVTWMFNNVYKKYRGESAAQEDIKRF